MIIRNIYSELEPPLEKFEDERGLILDIFYKKSIDHVALIKTKKDLIRGNHYHKDTTQYTLILEGSLEYWEKDLKSENLKSKICHQGDLITSEPNIIHAFKFLTYNEMLVFTRGPRGGLDYEMDTFRVNNIIPI